MKTASILGGMGPFAIITFYRTVIELSGLQCGVMRNRDYSHLLAEVACREIYGPSHKRSWCRSL